MGHGETSDVEFGDIHGENTIPAVNHTTANHHTFAACKRVSERSQQMVIGAQSGLVGRKNAAYYYGRPHDDGRIHTNEHHRALVLI